MTRWPSCQEQRFSQRWMLTVGLADSLRQGITPANYLHHTIRQVLLQEDAFWNLQCSRALPKEDEPTSLRPTWSSVLDGRCPHIWEGRKEHNDRLATVLKRIQTAGVTLNPSKFEFAKDQLKFLGHLIDQ